MRKRNIARANFKRQSFSELEENYDSIEEEEEEKKEVRQESREQEKAKQQLVTDKIIRALMMRIKSLKTYFCVSPAAMALREKQFIDDQQLHQMAAKGNTMKRGKLARDQSFLNFMEFV